MDDHRFDALARSLNDMSSRRGLSQRLAAATLGLAAFHLPAAVDARKRGKKRKKQPKLLQNAFGCVDVGQACRGNDANCCSGLCQGNKPKKGKKDKSTCVAHDTSTCVAGQKTVVCGGAADIACVISGQLGACQTTTGNGAYCENFVALSECNRDADCQASFGPRAACLVCAAAPSGRVCGVTG